MRRSFPPDSGVRIKADWEVGGAGRRQAPAVLWTRTAAQHTLASLNRCRGHPGAADEAEATLGARLPSAGTAGLVGNDVTNRTQSAPGCRHGSQRSANTSAFNPKKNPMRWALLSSNLRTRRLRQDELVACPRSPKVTQLGSGGAWTQRRPSGSRVHVYLLPLML